MKKLRVFQALTLLCMIFFITPLSQSATWRGVQIASKTGEVLSLYTDYCALVIGVGRYTNGWPDLPGAEKDSAEVAAALEDYGFKVKLVTNPTSREIKKAIAEMAFVTGKEEDRALLLYFAGHGETLNLADGTKLGHIIPSDCPLKDKDPLGFDDLAISMKEIEALALKIRSKHVLMVFDSCFSGSLFSLVRAAPVEISEKAARAVRQFISAGSEGEQVPDRSVFKQVFLDGIRSDADLNSDGYVTASELGMYLQTKVVNYSGGGQHPQYGKINNPRLDKGDFIFVPKATRQKEETETKKDDAEKARLSAERAQLSEELKKLQEERKKNEELLETMKKLLEARVRTEVAEKSSLEEKLKLAEKERQAGKADTDEKIRRMEAEGKAAQERMARELAEKKALEEELRKLRTESGTIREMEEKKGEEMKIADLPREVTATKLAKGPSEEPNLKIAILPIYPGNSFEERLIKAIHIAVDTSDLFKDVYSSYRLENRPDIHQLDKNLEKTKLWKWNAKPNLDITCEEAKKAGVDAVLAVYLESIHPEGGPSFQRFSSWSPPGVTDLTPTVYLINTSMKKAYSGQITVSREVNPFYNMMKMIFDDFRKDL